MTDLSTAHQRAPAPRDLHLGRAFLSRHWLAMANGFFLLAAAGSVLPPALEAMGLDGPAARLLGLYHLVCTQQPDHSFFLWGGQMALCQRDLALYGSMGMAGLLFQASGRRWNPLRWWWYLVLIAPIAVDGGSQLLGLRESTWALRLLTGALFGMATTWIAYPYLEDWSRVALAAGKSSLLARSATPAARPGDDGASCRSASISGHPKHGAG